jgi:hypothetical protein
LPYDAPYLQKQWRFNVVSVKDIIATKQGYVNIKRLAISRQQA